MPYRCLNTRCTKADMFQSQEKMPACPACGCIRTAWMPPARGASPMNTGQIDATFRGLADNFGLSNMGQRGGTHEGEIAKQIAQQKSEGTFGKMNVHGVEVPVEGTATAAWGKTSYAPFAVPTKGRFGGRQPIPTIITAATGAKR